jgi:hypothetical protein
MNIDVQRDVEKAMMALALDVASKKVYGADLPQGLQHESAQVNEDKFPMEKYEATLKITRSRKCFVKDLGGWSKCFLN